MHRLKTVGTPQYRLDFEKGTGSDTIGIRQWYEVINIELKYLQNRLLSFLHDN